MQSCFLRAKGENENSYFVRLFTRYGVVNSLSEHIDYSNSSSENLLLDNLEMCVVCYVRSLVCRPLCVGAMSLYLKISRSELGLLLTLGTS